MPRTAFVLASILTVATLFGAVATAGAPPPKVRMLTELELLDMLLGSSVQASRSSNTAATVERLKELLAQGHTFTMIAVEELPDDWTVVSPTGPGGGGAWEYVIERAKRQNLPRLPNARLEAIQALSKHIGKRFNAVVRVEPAGATISALAAAADLQVPIVDACLSGRARPERQQQIPTIVGIPSAPATLVSRWGDTVILDKLVDNYRNEDIARAVAVASGGSVSGAMNAMSGKDVKRGVIRGALTEAIRLGRTVREAIAAGRDPIDALVKVTNGYKLFHGVVESCATRGERGFTWSDVMLKGIGEDAGHTYRIYVKNENIVTWLDGVPDAMAPDFIQNLDPKTGDAHVGPALGAYRQGAEIVMLGWPASALWRVPKGIEIFGPRHFGFDFDYLPIEQLQRVRKNSTK